MKVKRNQVGGWGKKKTSANASLIGCNTVVGGELVYCTDITIFGTCLIILNNFY